VHIKSLHIIIIIIIIPWVAGGVDPLSPAPHQHDLWRCWRCCKLPASWTALPLQRPGELTPMFVRVNNRHCHRASTRQSATPSVIITKNIARAQKKTLLV